jgi:DNA-binding transcriptional LysR family regulator
MEMDRLRAMQIFTAVAEAGSLSRAGRELGVPLTTVSRQLAELEKHVGAPLIVRTTRQLALTDAGRDYLETCRSLLSELEAAEARLAGKEDTPSGELVLTAPVVFGRLHVLPVVLEYLRRYPGVSVKMGACRPRDRSCRRKRRCGGSHWSPSGFGYARQASRNRSLCRVRKPCLSSDQGRAR